MTRITASSSPGLVVVCATAVMLGSLTCWATTRALSYFDSSGGVGEKASDDDYDSHSTDKKQDTTAERTKCVKLDPGGDYYNNATTAHESSLSSLSASNEHIPRFPWEPTTTTSATAPPPTTTTTTKTTISAVPRSDSSTLQTEQEHMQQLEFLANMTFANGGLQAPICLCCR